MKRIIGILVLAGLCFSSIGANCAPPTPGLTSQAVQSTDVVFSRGGGSRKVN